MEISFWYLALVGGLLTWTTCTFLRAVALRAKQLREQITEQLTAAAKTAEPKEGEELTFGSAAGPEIAAVMNVPNKPKPTPKSPTNGSSFRAPNDKKNGHAASGGPSHRM